jgi:hypothetical protein
VKGQKNEILTRPESRSASIALRADKHTSLSDVFYFLPGVYSDAIGTHFLKQLPTWQQDKKSRDKARQSQFNKV